MEQLTDRPAGWLLTPGPLISTDGNQIWTPEDVVDILRWASNTAVFHPRGQRLISHNDHANRLEGFTLHQESDHPIRYPADIDAEMAPLYTHATTPPPRRT